MKDRLWRLGLHLLTAILLVPGVQAAPDAGTWAETLLQNSRQADYNGTIMVLQGNEQQAYRLWHEGGDGEFRERMRLLDGPEMEITRTPDRLTCVHAPGSEVPAEHDMPASPFGSLLQIEPEQLQKNYRLTEEGEQRLAGRQARVYLLGSRSDSPRLHHRVWVDTATGVALRHSRYGHDGTLLTDVRFVSFEPELGDAPAEIRSSFPQAFWHQFEESGARQRAGADDVWQLDPIPDGFVRQVEEEQDGEWYQLWSDGLVEFSLMVEPIVGVAPEPMTEQRGSTLLMSAVHGDWLVVLVGDVPEPLARSILSDISWQ
ncbi:MAG: MucB/RseB C-terminal domain-containing protein [Natronospirillum sp.]|uniref:MucB/RseB C-terminal domain-containing protein n=1 Tax=Natronospirillum sp. TaxID=2812955 RepID=UPI0025CDBF8D|nr:MucB/RseB C-terminal domain-containing protein [Natronospirillum sp.]MCH8550481.1 MucB/RseB C-terminal domain-containing protein [Natronospirillum sp.]